jgi:sugar phosphate isomerase/epimerase
MTLSRRHFLGASSALFALGACETRSVSNASNLRSIDQVGIQTYTLRDALSEDFVGTFQMIKDVGYDYVELNPQNFADRSPIELKQILDDCGLPSPITHVTYESLSKKTSELVETCNALGCKHVILPFIADNMRGLDDYKAHAFMLNCAGEQLKPNGISVGYHNHHFEFDRVGDDLTGMSVLLNETDPDLVAFELDLFWAAFANADIVSLFNQYPGRFRYCHIKDKSGEPGTYGSIEEFFADIPRLMKNVGEGELPFDRYFALNDVSGMEYFIVEHDLPPKPFRQSISTSYDAVRAMRF